MCLPDDTEDIFGNKSYVPCISDRINFNSQAEYKNNGYCKNRFFAKHYGTSGQFKI